MKKRQKLSSFIFSFLFLVLSAFSLANSDVRMDMWTMQKQFSALMSSKNVEEFHNAAQGLKAASLNAQAAVPSELEAGSEDYKGYQAGMQHFIDVLDEADKKAEQGDLTAAKEIASKLMKLKVEYHKKYK